MKTNEIKSKVKAKVKAKVEKKTGKKAKAILAFLGLSVLLVGCGSYPAAYSVTQDNKFDGCNFFFGSTNMATNVPSVEMFTLAQNLENQGSQTADQKSTNEIKPDTDVNVGGVGGGSGKGILEQAVDAVSAACKSDTTTNTTSNTGTSANANANANCVNGNCSDGACTDGSCSVK